MANYISKISEESNDIMNVLDGRCRMMHGYYVMRITSDISPRLIPAYLYFTEYIMNANNIDNVQIYKTKSCGNNRIMIHFQQSDTTLPNTCLFKLCEYDMTHLHENFDFGTHLLNDIYYGNHIMANLTKEKLEYLIASF